MAFLDESGLGQVILKVKGLIASVNESLTSHTTNYENPHGVTKSQLDLENVENKSSATIRGELTKENVTTALGFTPPTTDTVYTHPTYTAKSSGLYKVTVDGTGHVSEATAVTKSDITDLGIPGDNTTYPVVSTTANGLCPKRDGSETSFLRGDGTWAEIPSTIGTVLSDTEPTDQEVGEYWIKEY